MEIYYEDYRIKVVKNEAGRYDMYDNKYGGKKTWCNGTRKQINEKIQNILNKRSVNQKTTQLNRIESGEETKNVS